MRNSFPGYEYVIDEKNQPHNMYRGIDVGFGGYVYGVPGMYVDVALLDSASHHPNSILDMNCFGEYTSNFKDLLDARIAIKHKDFATARELLDGKLAKYLNDEEKVDALPQALKIAINSVYGLTAAKFDNPFKDRRNVNNIVALRGALFMKNLQDEVTKRGFTVVSIRTDSIKIAEATPEIIQFVMDYGKEYGYTFEHEATYSRMCLVNDAAYIAKYATLEECIELYGDDYVNGKGNVSDCKKHPGEWTATATQFQVPYVFKTLFSKEDIEFSDLCETKSVKDAIYLDMNEYLPDVSDLEKEYDKLSKKYPDWKSMLDMNALDAEADIARLQELPAEIAKGHNYIFVGKVGLFCPMEPGCGAGELVRESGEKNGMRTYAAVTGTKGYRWMESENVKNLRLEKMIDLSYYKSLANDAYLAISNYGDFNAFVDGSREEVKASILPF